LPLKVRGTRKDNYMSTGKWGEMKKQMASEVPGAKERSYPKKKEQPEGVGRKDNRGIGDTVEESDKQGGGEIVCRK